MTTSAPEGPSLAEAVAAGQLDIAALLGKLTDVAHELDEIHASGHIHGQVCSENVRLGGEGRSTLVPSAGWPRIGSIVYDVIPDRAAPEQLQRFGAAPSMDAFLFAQMVKTAVAGITQEVPDVLRFAADPSVPPRLRMSPTDLIAEVRRALTAPAVVAASIPLSGVLGDDPDWQRTLELAARSAFGRVDQSSPARPRERLEAGREPGSEVEPSAVRRRWWGRPRRHLILWLGVGVAVVGLLTAPAA